jgi:hypothetical protein
MQNLNDKISNEAQSRPSYLGAVISRFLTFYKIPRHISRPIKSCVFFVNVKEAKQYGIGINISTNKYDYGFSIHS